MFTGIVAAKGTIDSVGKGAHGMRLTVAAGALAAELSEGDSVSVNGVCLTATGAAGSRFHADVMDETLRRSSLGPLIAGDEVNLELALRAGERLGGHIVQGHVDGVGEVRAVEPDGFARRVRVAAPPGLLRYVVDKGSIAMDGVSLTVAEVDDEAFVVALIPETLERTTLGAVVAGARVNLEVDVLAKHVEKLVSPSVGAA